MSSAKVKASEMKPRIISLIASATEIVHALSMGEFQVGRSHECDYPESVKKLPVCTEPKFKTDGTSYEIDQRVRQVLQESLSVYRVHAETLDALEPTHIITQAHCEVCAVSLKDVEEAACRMISSKPKIVSLNPNSLSDIMDDIGNVARALDVPEKGTSLNDRLKGEMDEIVEKARKCQRKPTVALIEWIDPLMAAGNWMPELVEMAGGVSLFGEAGKHSPRMSMDEIARTDPDVIIVSPCGFDIPRTLQEMPILETMPSFAGLRAVKSNCVYIADGNQYFNRPGPRVLESLQIMAEILHPGKFSFGLAGKGYIQNTPLATR